MVTILDNLKDYKILLASKSPRRQEILSDLGLSFDVRVKDDIEESYPKHLTGSKIATYLASHKADAYKNDLKDHELVITADTIVSLNGEILEKPKNESDAFAMLKKLSDAGHKVFTGVCLMSNKKKVTFVAVTDVHFKALSNEEIEYYIKNYKPFDKAGAYGIQEWIGYIGVDKIEGSYFNVMGLPVQRLYEELRIF